jgi:hypothetical protein
MKKILTAFVMLVLFYSSSSAQVASGIPSSGERPSEGTYQLIHKDRVSEQIITLTDSQLTQLEGLRDNSKTVFVKFSEATTIMLPSKLAINDPSYVPLTGKIFINEVSNYEDYQNLTLVPFE